VKHSAFARKNDGARIGFGGVGAVRTYLDRIEFEKETLARLDYNVGY